MTKEQAIHLLGTALADLKAGDESAIQSLQRALNTLGIDLSGDMVTVGDISDATGVAIGHNIQMIVNQESVSGELEAQLSALLDELVRRDVTSAQRHVRIFLSSPGNVADERALAKKVIDNLAYDPLLKNRVTLEVVAWDRTEAGTPMLASMTPQEAINQGLAKPSETDILVVIFWSRMGTPLSEEYIKPEAYRFPTEGSWDDWRYFSGTEWEYIDAMEAARKTGRPYVIVYRRTEEPKIGLDDPNFDEKCAQYKLVKAFFSTFTHPDGSIKQGVNFYQTPSDFEKLFSEHLRDLIARLLIEMEQKSEKAVAGAPEGAEEIELWEGSPFPGLWPFGPEDAPIFFGRGTETDDLVTQLSESRLVAVVGASGSGKSSLVGAGLIPRLADNAIPGSKDWAVVRFTPDELGSGDPFAALAAAMRDDPLSIEEKYLAEHLRAKPKVLANLCEEALANRPNWAEVLLFVDQFEELFTRIDTSERDAFVVMLEYAAHSEKIRFILTLRADFYTRCVELPALASLVKNNIYPLAAPKRDALREMIERPAERAGLRFEHGLVRRILDDTGDDPGALALMAFALQQLYEGRQSGRLTNKAYDEFDGVQGAIGQQAQKAFDALEEDAQNALPAVFRELVEVSEDGTPTRRRVELSVAAPNPACSRLVAKLTEKRLLVQSWDEDNTPIVVVAHEALFHSWDLLAEWITEMSDSLAYGSSLLKDAQEWRQAEQHSDFLLHGLQLQLALEWLERAEVNQLVNNLQYEYITTSTEYARNKRRKTYLQVLLPFGVLSLIVFVIGISLMTRQIADSLEERFINQLFEALRVAGDGLVRQEVRHLEDLRPMTQTTGVPEAIQNADVNCLRELIEVQAYNENLDSVLVLDQSGNLILQLDAVRNFHEDVIDEYQVSSGGNFAQEPIVARVLAGESDLQGDKFAGIVETPAGPVLYTSAPVYRFEDDEALELVGAILVGDRLDRMLVKLKQEEILADITIYTAPDIPIISTLPNWDQQEQLDDLKIDSNLFKIALTDPENIPIQTLTLYEREYRLAYTSLALRGQTVGVISVALSDSFVLNSVSDNQFVLLIVYSLAAGSVGIFGYLVSKRVAGADLKINGASRPLIILVCLVPVFLCLASHLALIGFRQEMAEVNLMSNLTVDYQEWDSGDFEPINPELIGTIRADQLTNVAEIGPLPDMFPTSKFGPSTLISTEQPTIEMPPALSTPTPTPTTLSTLPIPSVMSISTQTNTPIR